MRRLSDRLSYLVSGINGRLGQKPLCPACGSPAAIVCDRKWFHTLFECQNCGLLYRFPSESAKQMADFYQDRYSEPDATDLPDDTTLASLVATNFKDTDLDRHYHLRVVQSLGVKPGMRVHDYGANWGYTTLQFERLGYDMTAFDISRRMAAFADKIGVKVHTNIENVGKGFDAVYSCHVLEHTPNPRQVILDQLSLVKLGGIVIGHTPNGSKQFREQRKNEFHRSWGQVHPVLLAEKFIQGVAGQRPYIATSDDRPEVLQWDHKTQVIGPLDTSGLLFALKRVA